jgi:hypothetical protein
LVFAWVEVAGERVAGPAGAEDYYTLAVWMGKGGLVSWLVDGGLLRRTSFPFIESLD